MRMSQKPSTLDKTWINNIHLFRQITSLTFRWDITLSKVEPCATNRIWGSTLRATEMHVNPRRATSNLCCNALCLLIGILLFGCSKAPIATWSATAPSPDGVWVAEAHSEQGGGFGGDNDVTIVQLRRTAGSQAPIQILLFSQEYATISLQMNWVNSSQLNVLYGPSSRPGDHVSLDFQAIKCAGVDITARDVSSVSPSISSPK